MQTTLVTRLADGTTLRLEVDGSYLNDRRFERFLQVIEASPRARDERCLAPERMAALTMLDELRGLFATNDLRGARRLVERCFLDLQQAFEMPAITSDASIGRPITKEPRILGWLAEYALATALQSPGEALARVRALARLAADLDGGPRTPFETRPDRVRRHLFALPPLPDVELRALPIPGIHPAMWPAAATHVGISIAELRRQISFGDDAIALVAGLPPGLLFAAVPRIPEEERPPLVFPPHDRYGTPTTIDDAFTRDYNELLATVAYVEMMRQPGVPEIMLATLQGHVQRRIDVLADTAAADIDPYTLDAWGARTPLLEPMYPYEIAADDEPRAPSCAWLSDDTVAIARDGIVHVRSVTTGVEHDAFPIGGSRLQACDDRGRFLLVCPEGLLDCEHDGVGFACRDLEAREWLDDVPVQMPAVSYRHVLQEPRPGDNRGHRAFLIDYRSGAEIEVEPRDFAPCCFARGNRAVMLRHDGLRSTETGFIEVAAAVIEAREADVDGTFLQHAPARSGIARQVGTATACAKVGDRWRFLLANGHVAEVDRTLLRLGWTVRAASFSPDGRRLLVVGEHDTVVVDLEHAVVAHVIPDEAS